MLKQTLARISKNVRNRKDLHLRFAILASQWVDRNFQRQGALTGKKWDKLSPNTIEGRINKSSSILQNRRILQQSFLPRWNEKQATIGSPLDIALWHHKGTKSFSISPKKKDFLAFPHAQGTPLKKAFTFPSKERKFKKGTRFVFTNKTIQHPGLPARPMLPTGKQILPQLLRAALNYVRQAKAGK